MQAMRRLYAESPSKTGTVFYVAPVDDDGEPVGSTLMVDFGEVDTKDMSDKALSKSMIVCMKASEMDDWIKVHSPAGAVDDLTK